MIDDDEAKQEGRRKKIKEAEYLVGFGKTPPATKFKPGKSGNPKGRPKKALGIKTMVRKAAEAPVEYLHKGKAKKSVRLQVGLDQLCIKASKGELKAIEVAARLYAQYGPLPEADNDEIDPVADEAALAAYFARQSKFAKN